MRLRKIAIECRQRFGTAAAGRDAHHRAVLLREDDHTLAIPAAAGGRAGRTDRRDRAAARGDAIQLAAGEKRDLLPVRRPERLARAVSIGDRLRCSGIQRADPQMLAAGRIGGDEREPAAVGRQSQRVGEIHALGWEDQRVQRQRGGGRRV